MVEEEVEEGMKTIVIEFFFRFSVFCFFFFLLFFSFFGYFVSVWLQRKVKQKISVLIWFSYCFRLKG